MRGFSFAASAADRIIDAARAAGVEVSPPTAAGSTEAHDVDFSVIVIDIRPRGAGVVCRRRLR